MTAHIGYKSQNSHCIKFINLSPRMKHLTKTQTRWKLYTVQCHGNSIIVSPLSSFSTPVKESSFYQCINSLVGNHTSQAFWAAAQKFKQSFQSKWSFERVHSVKGGIAYMVSLERCIARARLRTRLLW